ncbi:G/U mismatch-specific uracil DNA glycosylase [Erysiphe necator]|nr:G/U mismatch-specific uracil DNA glycosylase [Erysiphe necator]
MRESQCDEIEENLNELPVSKICKTSHITSFKDFPDLSKYTYSPNINANELGNIKTIGQKSNHKSESSCPQKLSNRQSLTLSKNLNIAKRKRKTLSDSDTTKLRESRFTNAACSGRYASLCQYSHLPELPDVLASNLICIFIGLNPGLATSISGHAYAHPSNLFWKLLHSSGCTPRRCHPTEDAELPKLYALGNTNIVSRPTRNSSQLKKTELDAGVSIIEDKIRNFKPEAVCIVGKSIWESIWRTRHGKNISKSLFHYGWQDESERMGIESGISSKWKGARVFVACSTSGLAANLKLDEKQEIWRELGVWVEGRRKLRSKQSENEID